MTHIAQWDGTLLPVGKPGFPVDLAPAAAHYDSPGGQHYVQAGSAQLVDVVLRADGARVTDGVDVAAVRGGESPSWRPALVVDGKTCLNPSSLAPGRYELKASVVHGHGRVVVHAGALRVQ